MTRKGTKTGSALFKKYGTLWGMWYYEKTGCPIITKMLCCSHLWFFQRCLLYFSVDPWQP